MLKEALEALQTRKSFALIGASAEPGKYGHKVFSALKDQYRVLPVNPKRSEIEGVPCYRSFRELPETPDAVIVALAPEKTEEVVSELIAQRVRMLWLPPECFTDAAVAACNEAHIPVIYDICPVAALETAKRLKGAGGR
ncbi:MAG: CoA-binding protein [Thermoanaerobaculia bacterium]